MMYLNKNNGRLLAIGIASFGLSAILLYTLCSIPSIEFLKQLLIAILASSVGAIPSLIISFFNSSYEIRESLDAVFYSMEMQFKDILEMRSDECTEKVIEKISQNLISLVNRLDALNRRNVLKVKTEIKEIRTVASSYLQTIRDIIHCYNTQPSANTDISEYFEKLQTETRRILNYTLSARADL